MPSPPLAAAEQQVLQRQLADLITSSAPIDEIRMLLISGAKADREVTQGLLPLHYACYRDYLAAAKLLLVRGAQVNAVDEVGYSALHLCAEYGNYSIIKLLLEYTAQVSYVDEKGNEEAFPLRERNIDEPLRLAIRHNHFDCAKLLLEHGADPNAKYFDGAEITQIRPTDVHFLQLLLKHGADPNVYDRDGLTPLMKACRQREHGIPAVRLLLQHKADINAQALPKQDNRTALHYAILSGSITLVHFLIQNGANVNMPITYDKPSPLDLAVLKDDPELLQLLLDAGASTDAVHTYIGSSLHLACCSLLSHQYEIVELLLDYGADVNLWHQFPEGGVLKTPLVEYFRSRDQVDDRLIKKINGNFKVRLMLSYGGQIIMRSPLSDARGQLRNLLRVAISPQPSSDTFRILVDMAEQYDRLALERLPLPVWAKTLMLRMATNVPPLVQICRLRMRRLLTPLRPDKVQQLPIPIHLRPYLLGLTFL